MFPGFQLRHFLWGLHLPSRCHLRSRELVSYVRRVETNAICEFQACKASDNLNPTPRSPNVPKSLNFKPSLKDGAQRHQPNMKTSPAGLWTRGCWVSDRSKAGSPVSFGSLGGSSTEIPKSPPPPPLPASPNCGSRGLRAQKAALGPSGAFQLQGLGGSGFRDASTCSGMLA